MDVFQIFNSSPSFYTSLQTHASNGLPEIYIHMFGMYLQFAVSKTKTWITVLTSETIKKLPSLVLLLILVNVTTIA